MKLWFVLALSCSRSPSPPPSPTTAPVPPVSSEPPRAAAPVRATGPWGIALRGDRSPAPPIVYFHGMYASPEDSCGTFEAAARPLGVLVCPRMGVFEDALAHARELVELGGHGMLMGFSIGAKTALDRAKREKGRFTGLFLMAMPLALDASTLRTAGVRGVVLAAGERDGSYASLAASAKQLERAGYPVRFVSLGKDVGHHFGPNLPVIATDALSWLDALP